MNTTAVLTYRFKGESLVRTERYNLVDVELRERYEEQVDLLRAIKDDAGNYIKESLVDYMVTSFEVAQ